MALYTELAVYRDTYQLILKVFEYSKDFPREYRFTSGQDMKRDSLQLVRNLYRANKAQNKQVYLEHFLDDFELLKLEIRIAMEMKLMSIKKQATLSRLMECIGRQVTGWRNHGLFMNIFKSLLCKITLFDFTRYLE
ncbi:four helix bundle protein, partial [Legionella bozemanae]|uniref:four helix bundle protein n=1 Tax=Legionella bozemanae TaxID=447 RepID=UPI003EEED577